MRNQVLYGDSLYGQYLYASLFDEIIEDVDTPQDLQIFRNTVDNSYTFHWTFSSDFIRYLNDFDWELEIDKVNTFDSEEKLIYNKEKITISSIGPYKSLEMILPIESFYEDKEYFARIRIYKSNNSSTFSKIKKFKIQRNYKEEFAENLLRNLP